MWKRLRSCFICGPSSGSRSGSPDKLTNVSSSCEGETPEQYGKQQGSDYSNKNAGLEAKGHKNEGAQLIQNEESEGKHNLRHRLSAKNSKSQNGQDAEQETKANLTESNAPNELLNDNVETRKENETPCENENISEILPARETKEVKKQEAEINIKTNTCNDDTAPGNIPETFKNAENNKETTEIVEQKFVQENEAESVKNAGDIQEETNVNNAVDSVKYPLIGDDVQKATRQDVLVKEPVVKLSEAVSSEAAVEVQDESSFSLEGRESIRRQGNIAGDLSNDLNVEVIANESAKPLGVGEINQDRTSHDEHFVVGHAEQSDDTLRENAEILAESQHANIPDISEPLEVSPDNVIKTFADRLSKCIIDAVLQDTHLLYSQSEDENDENRNKQSILKFSDLLAESIVKTVIDYTKVSHDHISEHDEHDRMSPNVAEISDKTNENITQDVPDEPSPTNEEEIFSADEANDDGSAHNLHDYAKRLSQQILNDVLNMNGDPTWRKSTDNYALKLTKSVLSNAINGAKSQIGDTNSLADSDLGTENTLDLFIAEIVGNAVESAISKVGMETSTDRDECNGIEVDIQEQQGEHGEDRGEISMDRDNHLGTYNERDIGQHKEDFDDSVGNDIGNEDHLGMCNGEIDTPVEHINHEGVRENGSNTQLVQQNGKLQSKWLSEDDLDELYDDDLSDEEATAPEHESSVRNSNDDNELVTNANLLKTPNEEKQFWRKSLIDDLDDELEFDDEIETPRSSQSSSPTKSGNIEDLVVDGSEESDDEVLDTSPNVKVQTPIVKTTDASRSRLRSVDTSPILVLDNGSASLKVGFSNQSLPKEIVSSVVGTPLRYSQDIAGMEYSARPGLVYGDSAMGKAGVLHIEYPLKCDVIEKWSEVEGLWNYVLGSLMCIQDNPDFPVLISQPALNSKKHMEKIAEIMFEHFHMPSLFIADQLALSLFSMGYTSGLSFSSGFKSTQAGVVYEGHVLTHTVKQLDIAGYQLTETLKKLIMSLQGFGFRSSSQWQIVDDIKKKLGFFSLDFAADSARYKTQAHLQTTYELPDGQVIEVGLERFGCAESMFRPMEVGLTQSPAHMLIIEAINSCEAELQELCYKAMGISGGTTQMTGFIARLEQELRVHDRKFKNLTVPEQRDLATWIGGSVVASLPTFREMVVTVDEYAESGARIVHSRCF